MVLVALIVATLATFVLCAGMVPYILWRGVGRSVSDGFIGIWVIMGLDTLFQSYVLPRLVDNPLAWKNDIQGFTILYACAMYFTLCFIGQYLLRRKLVPDDRITENETAPSN